MSASVGVFGLRRRKWVVIGRWLIPCMMLVSYALLVYTADTDLGGALWIGLGYFFVLLCWSAYRIAMAQGALARAASVGDADRLLEETEDRLARTRRPAARARYEVYRALAYDARGDWSDALASLDRAKLDALPPGARRPWDIYAAAVRVAAYVETGRIAEARAVLDRDLAGLDRGPAPRLVAHAYLLARVAHGRVLAAEGATEAALDVLQRVIDDLRAGDSARAIAHHVAARCAVRRGDAAGAARHQELAAKLAPRSWAASPEVPEARARMSR